MQLFRTLFCQQGCDDRTRYATITASSYLIFIVSSAIFYTSSIITSTLLLLLTAIATFSTLRRLKDAQLSKNWLLAPSLSFLITGLIITFIKIDGLYWLLILPILCNALLLTYPSKVKRKYILGYFGPIDLSDLDQSHRNLKRHNNRIEPTLRSDGQQANIHSQAFEEQTTSNNSTEPQYDRVSSQQDIGEAVRLALIKNKNPTIIISIAITIIVVALIVNAFTQSNVKAIEETIEQPKLPDTVREFAVELPDNFNVMLSQYQGVIVGWQGDATPDNSIWNLADAQGDQSCEYIKFNNGNKIRTINVYSENDGDFYANFSPLDTEQLINNIVFRGNFSLCGYKFSLKGSQAALGKHEKYAEFINY